MLWVTLQIAALFSLWNIVSLVFKSIVTLLAHHETCCCMSFVSDDDVGAYIYTLFILIVLGVLKKCMQKTKKCLQGNIINVCRKTEKNVCKKTEKLHAGKHLKNVCKRNNKMYAGIKTTIYAWKQKNVCRKTEKAEFVIDCISSEFQRRRDWLARVHSCWYLPGSRKTLFTSNWGQFCLLYKIVYFY